MRVIVVSDTHRDFRTLLRIVDKHRQEAALFLHLGDGEQEVEDVKNLYPDLPITSVRGNCDFSWDNPTTRVVTAGNVRIFMAHGHDLGVTSSTEMLVRLAPERLRQLRRDRHHRRGDRLLFGGNLSAYV